MKNREDTGIVSKCVFTGLNSDTVEELYRGGALMEEGLRGSVLC